MKKKRWVPFSFIGIFLILGIGIMINANKPNLADYSNWLEGKYHVKCLDFGCESFTLKVKGDGQKKTLTMHNMHGGYDSGLFTMTKEAHYRSFGRSPYALDIKVRGFNGSFNVENAKNTLPH